MNKDKLFVEKADVTDFNFGEKTAIVFDDMLERSVPLYQELQRMIGELANDSAASDSNIYDLGCSTGITLRSLISAVDKDVNYIGVDNSQAMLDKAREDFREQQIDKSYDFVLGDLNEGFVVENASVVVLNLTLQFIRPLQRDLLIRNIYSGLNRNGCLILIEKSIG